MLILEPVVLKLVAPLEVKKKQAVEEKVDLTLGRPICEDKPILLTGAIICH
jgi:hypothetical protein